MDISGLRDLIGKDFEYGGKGPDTYDCYNLCREVYRRNGIDLPEFASSDEMGLIHQSVFAGRELFQRLKKTEPLCLVTFRLHPVYVTHVGVVISWPYFIHIMQKRRAVIERLDAPEWKKRIEGYYAWKNN